MIRIRIPNLSAPGFRLAGTLAVLIAVQAFVIPTPTAPPRLQETAPPPRGSGPRLVASLDPRTPLPAEARRWVDETLSQMSLEQLAGQVMMVRAHPDYFAADAAPRQQLTGMVRELGLGGFVLFRSEAYEAAALVNDLQGAAAEAGVPSLLLAADFERGAEFRIGDAVPYPTPMAIGAADDPEAAEWMGRAGGRDARALGIHWVLAPVSDVNINPRNPVINVRSFGEDPERVSELAAAFIRGAQSAGALATAKHFPGHGDTAVDSHINVPVLRFDAQRLQGVELAPFRAAIDAGVGAIMTAHVAVPALTADEELPATLSAAVLTDLLRRQMNFRGLVVTDAMDMGGITRNWWSGEAAVRALAAGADMVLLPLFPRAVRGAIVRAVESGELAAERLEEAVRRVLTVKARLGLQNGNSTRPLTELPSRFAPSADAAIARRVAEAAVTLLRDRRGILPLDAREPHRVVVVGVSDSRTPVSTAVLTSALRRRLESVTSGSIDGRTSGDEAAALMTEAARSDVVIMAVRVAVRSYQERIRLPTRQARYAGLLARLEVPVITVALGSPYVVSAFPETSAAVVAYGAGDPLQEALAAALVGEIPWRGRLPVTVPGVYPRNFGLERAALDATLRTWAGIEAEIEERRADDAIQAAASAPEAVPAAEPAVQTETIPRSPEAEGFDRPAELEDEDDSAAALAALNTILRPDDLAQARAALQQAMASRAFPGAVFAVGHRNVLVAVEALGRMTYALDAPPMSPDTVFDLASVTKVVATTTIAMRAVEEGRLRLDHPVQAYVPEFEGAGKDAVTVRQLLVHTSGLPAYVRFFLDYGPAEAGLATGAAIRERIYATELEAVPGERYAYSDLGIILLGEVLTRALGEPYDEYSAREIFEPLGMSRSRWKPPAAWRAQIPPTEEDPWRGRLVWGEVHDENAAAMGGVAPHAGLFSTAGDLAIFAQMLLNGGTYDHRRILRRTTLRRWTRRQNLVAESSRALGWDTARPSRSWSMFSSSAFGHTGFTGTSLWIDPDRELFVILLTNRVHPTRENGRIREARVAFHTAVVEAVDQAMARR